VNGHISKRELQVARLAASGMTDKEIAREFGVTVPTVRTYWQRLRAKTNSRSRTQATYEVLIRQRPRFVQPEIEA
jgi:DNA-binding CsgD family transcriptional regulator